ncbi:hypothetical protein G4B88_025527 [Cannabis sativa]|uniref:Uncharacterized protein n=1 Tax=Cannabis sativa TaxID=3483 RepID=A0A7J6F2E8_CANSA|nr:hypothetical protein G4B88_025527 [Cannabis sativa]
MGHPTRRETLSGSYPAMSRSNNLTGPPVMAADSDLVWPFRKLHGIDRDDVRETAYEIFFTACRSSPGFGGRNALNFYSNNDNNNSNNGMSSNNNNGDGHNGNCVNGPGLGGGPKQSGHVVTTPTSRVKRALGLKMIKRSPSRRMVSGSSNPSSPGSTVNAGGSPGMSFTVPQLGRARRPMTSAEIMRQQMRVTEQSDNRLRKTLMRTLVGQMGRRAETIILPLELLRHLKPSEFNDSHEYHLWQKRQLKILEAGLLLHPSIPLEKPNTFATRLRDIIRAGESKPIDTGKNSDTMRTLCNSVVSLSWRSPNGSTPTDVCHWADGFPVNVHVYVALLQSIFDVRDETLVLDEVDELLELMKKTWSTLGITRQIHNVCFTWVLFHQYVATAMVEQDLLYASHTMLAEVASDAKKLDRDVVWAKILSSVLGSILGWAEKRMLRYHDYFLKGNVSQIENLLPLALSASRILGEDFTITEGGSGSKGKDKRDMTVVVVDSSRDRVDHYIRSSVKNAFAKIIEHANSKEVKEEEASEALLQLAKETEELALKEREGFSPILKRWHSTAVGVAAVTLHSCYGAVLKQYLSGVSTLSCETVGVLQRAGKLEKMLVQMVVEDSVDCDDGGKSIVREMVPYEVDYTWNPKSKSEPYAQSAVELTRLAKETVEEFFEIPIGITEDLVQDLADGLENLFQDYTTFVASCGSKQSYVPTLPPLTRCNRDSKFLKLWKKASPCGTNLEESYQNGITNEGHHPRQSTSRGTQRLYIRLNTLHYLLTHINSLDKSLSMSPRIIPSTRNRFTNTRKAQENSSSSNTTPSSSYSYFERAHSSIQSAGQHVSEVAAYRLIFLDSNSVFYESLYVDDVANARIRPALRTLKQNLTLMSAMLTDRAQALAMREVMKASFEAFLMVLLAGGSSRVFLRSDQEMIEEDFESLKRVFCTSGGGEGLITEGVVEREAETVEGVIGLMGQCTEQLMEDFSIITCETSGIGVVMSSSNNNGSGNTGLVQKLPMPPTTGRWHRSDPNTILRVLCHRNDRTANQFLKRNFQLAKRR